MTMYLNPNKASRHAKCQARWERAKIMAFWDRPKITLSICREKIQANDKRTIIQCMLYMESKDVALIAGETYFNHHYPMWRKWLDKKDSRTILKKSCLDAQWSWANCDTLFVRQPTVKWFTLTKKQRETFFCISMFGFEPVYRVAKRLDRHYRRVWDDVHVLIDAGLIQSRRKKINGRKVLIVAV